MKHAMGLAFEIIMVNIKFNGACVHVVTLPTLYDIRFKYGHIECRIDFN